MGRGGQSWKTEKRKFKGAEERLLHRGKGIRRFYELPRRGKLIERHGKGEISLITPDKEN